MQIVFRVESAQSEWLDLTAFEDCVLWVDVRDLEEVVPPTLQTSPSEDDGDCG